MVGIGMAALTGRGVLVLDAVWGAVVATSREWRVCRRCW